MIIKVIYIGETTDVLTHGEIYDCEEGLMYDTILIDTYGYYVEHNVIISIKKHRENVLCEILGL